jgi:hypothetical protein
MNQMQGMLRLVGRTDPTPDDLEGAGSRSPRSWKIRPTNSLIGRVECPIVKNGLVIVDSRQQVCTPVSTSKHGVVTNCSQSDRQ